MFLHKYKTDAGTVFLISGKRSPGKLTLVLPSAGKETISGESVKNFLSNIESKFKDEPLPPEEEKTEAPEEEKEPEEKEKKATYAEVIRQYAGVIKQYASTLKD
jgi:hypothetical protein